MPGGRFRSDSDRGTSRIREDLGALARERLALIAAVNVGCALLAFFLGWLLASYLGKQSPLPMTERVSALRLLIIGLSLGVVFLARAPSPSCRATVVLALTYEVAIAGCLSGIYLEPQIESGGLTWLAVWIVLFPLVVPLRPRTHLVGMILAAAMGPLFYGLACELETARWAPEMLVAIVIANGFAVAAAYVPAHFMYRAETAVREVRAELHQLGSYRLTERLGQGGMGEVWRAEHALLARPAAIKRILPDRNQDPQGQVVQRFQREARVTASLRSPHTIQLYDYGVEEDGSFYYVMELLDGLDLKALVGLSGPLPPERVVHLLLQVCKSLEEAHARGLIHRDLKPANIFCCRLGNELDFVKVLDFGLVKELETPTGPDAAKLTNRGAVLGTPLTISPEAATNSEEVGPPSDIYSLGCVAYTLLTGTPVFQTTSGIKIIVDHIRSRPEPPSERLGRPLPAELEALVLACLEKAPAQRPASAAELGQALRSLDLAQRWSPEAARAWWEQHWTDAGPPPTSAADRGAQARAETVTLDPAGE